MSPRVRICARCGAAYSEQVSCPDCSHIPSAERAGYVPPDPCKPWRVDLTFPDAELHMTVRGAAQRRLVHEVVRQFGGGSAR